MTTMTLRGIDETLAQALKEMAQNQGVSMNTVTLNLIREATGVDKRKRTAVYHDLDALAGTWSKDDELAFQNSIRSLECIDEDMWK